MNNKQYTEAVERGEYPESPLVPLDDKFANEAGKIINLVLSKNQISSIGCITSFAGAVRSNHYHKTDWHYMYVVRGEMHYFWRPVGSKEEPKMNVIWSGELMFTPPMVEHATFFPYECEILTFAKNVRNHEGHESDLVRVPMIEIDPDYVPRSASGIKRVRLCR